MPRRTLLLAVAALASALVTAALAERPVPPAAPASPVAVDGGLRFAPDVPPAARRAVLAAVAESRPLARAAIRAVAGRVVIHVVAGACQGSGGPNCTIRRPGASDLELVLDPGSTRAGDRVGAFVILHELGHAVDWLLVRPAHGPSFAALARRSSRFATCGRPCAGDMTEAFADEFARWALADDRSRTTYETPPLLSSADVSAIVASALP